MQNPYFKNVLDKGYSLKIVMHHDMLRATYHVGDNSVVQTIGDLDAQLYSLDVYYLVDKENYEVEVESICNNIHSSINLATGPLVKLGLFKTKGGDHLLITIHHLVIDGVSWRILMEDLVTGYNSVLEDKEIKLPDKSTSFMRWSNKLNDYSSSERLLNELEYWKKIEETNVKPLPKKAAKELSSDVFKNVSSSLSREKTDQLLSLANKAYNTEINDLLLVALGLSVKEWVKDNKILISLEGHGREELFKDVDITRTIGWFTAVYPVILDMEKSDDLGYLIKNTKEELRRVPNKGIGYGILKHLTPNELKEDIDFKLEPEICFNYLGQFDKDVDDSLLKMSNLKSGSEISTLNLNKDEISINGMITNGKLNFTFTFNLCKFAEREIERLAESYMVYLGQVISHTCAKGEVEFTPSDLGDSDISIEELGDFMEELQDLF